LKGATWDHVAPFLLCAGLPDVRLERPLQTSGRAAARKDHFRRGIGT
jgi:hypothetical protein